MLQCFTYRDGVISIKHCAHYFYSADIILALWRYGAMAEARLQIRRRR